jgi:hypothetical protein
MSSAHDRFCPVQSQDAERCPFCADLRRARDETRSELQDTWQRTLRDVEKREYARGWQDGRNGKPAVP